ncbi:SipW-dependent-type signal peptide-containing protein [Dietzia sp. 179-F 9C3 NHS]|uniref:SipW-dependent-type signal peptide-containing protein n=1 Tax=Dietzia sp. 179-F 9C3 NHS TaxID=3374295 RepID=UPI00387A15D5
MSDDHTTDQPTEHGPTGRATRVRHALSGRRARALLAGGVVLGLGTAGTLAAYSDSEWVSSAFSAAAVEPPGVLKLEGSKDGSTWEKDVTMALPVDASKMTVGTAYFAPLYLRLSADTTIHDSAEVTVGGATITGTNPDALAQNVMVDLLEASTSQCDSGMPAPISTLRSQLMNSASPSSAFFMNAPTNAGQPGATKTLCMKFVLQQRPTGTAPHTAKATWTVTATEHS